MKPVSRRFKRHYGVSARRVAVKSQQPWYWQWLMAAGLIVLGYFLAYWQFTGGNYSGLKERAEQLSKESQTLQAKIIYNESQLRIEQATQNNLAKQLTTAQDENMKLKQDVELYKNMLSQRSKSPQ